MKEAVAIGRDIALVHSLREENRRLPNRRTASPAAYADKNGVASVRLAAEAAAGGSVRLPPRAGLCASLMAVAAAVQAGEHPELAADAVAAAARERKTVSPQASNAVESKAAALSAEDRTPTGGKRRRVV